MAVDDDDSRDLGTTATGVESAAAGTASARAALAAEAQVDERAELDDDEVTGGPEDEAEGDEDEDADDDTEGEGDEEDAAAGEASDEPPPAVGETAEESEFRRRLRDEYGVATLPGANDDAVMQHIAHLFHAEAENQRVRQRNAQLEYEFQRVAAERQQAEQAQRAQTEQPKGPWEVSEWDPAMERFLQRNPETGAIEVVPGGDPALLPQYRAFEKSKAEAESKFWYKPVDTLWDGGIADRVRQEAQQVVQSMLGQMREQSFAQHAIKTNAEWMFEHDAHGNVLLDMAHNPVRSQKGNAYVAALAELQASGVGDVEQQHRLAVRLIGGEPERPAGAQRAASPSGAAAATPAGAAKARPKTTAERDAEQLRLRNRSRSVRSGDRGAGSRKPTNGRHHSSTTTARRLSVADNPAWNELDEAALEAEYG